ncbi:MAG: Mur ligase domain-containing protein, partial [Solirubrobacteraceae bacterium]
MNQWTPQQVADAAGAELAVARPVAHGPERVMIDSRQVGPGALFIGLRGEHHDGGEFAAAALACGAWGVLTTPRHADRLDHHGGVILTAPDPLIALQRLATAWRR